jgi:hypothetical protein
MLVLNLDTTIINVALAPQRALVRASVVNVGPHAADGLRTAAFTAFTQSMGSSWPAAPWSRAGDRRGGRDPW